jgi:glutathione S-transferase
LHCQTPRRLGGNARQAASSRLKTIPVKNMKLLGSLTSPYVRKVRIVMAEKKIDYQLAEEDVWSPASAIHQSNPLGKVPCLVMQDGEAVFDSRVIVEYLDTLSPVSKLIPANGRERVEVRTWEALADGICDAAILARLEQTWAGRTAEQRSQKWIDRQMEKIHAGLKAMSHGLGDKPYCAGVHYTLADIATGVALGYLDFRFAQIDWRTSYPNLAKLSDKLAQRASFADTAPPK